jgi:hypothetical protein
MSLPAPHEPRHDGGKWETIHYALDSNARTLRLCLLWFVAIVSPTVATVITLLLRHVLLCGPGARPGAVGSGQPGLGEPPGLAEVRTFTEFIVSQASR